MAISRFPAIPLGPLPAAAINRALGTELEPGDVLLSAQAHRHVATDHAADYAVCIAALPGAVAAPNLVGQAPKHGRNFELVKRIALQDGRALLVAIGLEPDDTGTYRVRSCYPLTPEEVQNKRDRGTLKLVLPL